MQGEFVKLVEDTIAGGLADYKTAEDVAEKYGVPLEDVQKELEAGIKVEREHTNSDKIAKEIAIDHLWENLNYYSALADMEKTNEK